MKKIILAAIAALVFFNASAQGDKAGWREKIMAEKVAFISTELELTPEEAQVFWPVYNKAEAERNNLFKASRAAYKNLKEAIEQGAPEERIKALTKGFMEIQKKGPAIDSKYFEEYSKILSPEKMAKLILSEEKFRRTQIHKLGGNKLKS